MMIARAIENLHNTSDEIDYLRTMVLCRSNPMHWNNIASIVQVLTDSPLSFLIDWSECYVCIFGFVGYLSFDDGCFDPYIHQLLEGGGVQIFRPYNHVSSFP